MNSLKIPDSGVMLKGSPGEDSDPIPQQAFTISLDDNVIEGMIKCFQNGGDIQLALGSNPVSLSTADTALCRAKRSSQVILNLSSGSFDLSLNAELHSKPRPNQLIVVYVFNC